MDDQYNIAEGGAWLLHEPHYYLTLAVTSKFKKKLVIH